MKPIALAVWLRGDRAFLQRRSLESAILPGLWEFPGGKVDAGESLETACLREFKEEVGVSCRVVRSLAGIEHVYAHGKVQLQTYLVEGEGWPTTRLAWGWFAWREMERLPLPAANRLLLGILREVCF